MKGRDEKMLGKYRHDEELNRRKRKREGRKAKGRQRDMEWNRERKWVGKENGRGRKKQSIREERGEEG